MGVDRVAAAHKKRWGAILYQYFIGPDGAILQTEPIDAVVDLAQPWIAQAINIGLAGNFNDNVPPQVQIDATARLCAWLMQEYQIPAERIKGASEFIATQSPGLQWSQGKVWKNALLNGIARVQNSGAPELLASDLARLAGPPAGRPEQSGRAEQRARSVADPGRRADRGEEQVAGAVAGVERGRLTDTANRSPHQRQRSRRHQLGRGAETGRRRCRPASRRLRAGSGQAGPRGKGGTTRRSMTLPTSYPSTRLLRYDSRPLKQHHAPRHPSQRGAGQRGARVNRRLPCRARAGRGSATISWSRQTERFTRSTAWRQSPTTCTITISYLVGICTAGNFNDVIPTPLQIQRLGELVAWLMQELNIPIERVMGHKEFPEDRDRVPGQPVATGQNWRDLLHARYAPCRAGSSCAHVSATTCCSGRLRQTGPGTTGTARSTISPVSTRPPASRQTTPGAPSM